MDNFNFDHPQDTIDPNNPSIELQVASLQEQVASLQEQVASLQEQVMTLQEELGAEQTDKINSDPSDPNENSRNPYREKNISFMTTLESKYPNAFKKDDTFNGTCLTCGISGRTYMITPEGFTCIFETGVEGKPIPMPFDKLIPSDIPSIINSVMRAKPDRNGAIHTRPESQSPNGPKYYCVTMPNLEGCISEHEEVWNTHFASLQSRQGSSLNTI